MDGDTRSTTQLDRLLRRPGPFTDPEMFEGGEDAREFMTKECRVLVVGAGGLGCEVLKNLAVAGFRNIDVIDMDQIELSNLNRQFLFRSKDIGRPKAIVAAEFVMSRCPNVKVTAHYKRIQEMEAEFYRKFHIIISGLDSVDARRWMNAMVVEMFDDDDPMSQKPLIDGGSEAFRGHARLILPFCGPCYECTIAMITPQKKFPICTIANTPRSAEHCIAYAQLVEWPASRKDESFDPDSPDHVAWVFERARIRARQFGLPNVTFFRTLGFVKNVVPAVASTNALVAAVCVNEAVKLATNIAPAIQNYFMYSGEEKIYSYTFELERSNDCAVCARAKIDVDIPGMAKVEDLLEVIANHPSLRLAGISVRSDAKTIYASAPPELESLTSKNLAQPLKQFVDNGGELYVTAPALLTQVILVIRFKD